MDTSQSSLLAGYATVYPGQAVYVNIPAHVIRDFVDSKFPMLAKCQDADFIKGYGHRWQGGHDLLVDVPSTLIEHGPSRAAKHCAHIVLTDLPTKGGIPIPGLSGSSPLGHFLVDAGIPKGYLSIHFADGALGILAISEGSTDLIQAIHGSLEMSTATFFDTFVEGGVEIWLALLAKMPVFNPALVIVGGVENVLAGLISVYQHYSVYVDPLVFFGSAGTSALLGFGIAYGMAGQSLNEASVNAARSGGIGAMFSLSPAFGYGALAGFISYKLGSALAAVHNKSIQATYKIDKYAYQQLLDEMCAGNADLSEFLKRADIQINLDSGAVDLPDGVPVLDNSCDCLDDTLFTFNRTSAPLPHHSVLLQDHSMKLQHDSQVLLDWYRRVLA